MTKEEIVRWIVVGVGMILVLAACEIGFRIGHRSHNPARPEAPTQISTLQASVLGLLALMVGFTFSMALSRFEARRDAVLAEANAIGTVALRAGFLEPDSANKVVELLRRYTTLRLNVVDPNLDQAGFKYLLDESNGIQDRLWRISLDAGNRAPQSQPISLFIQSVNSLVDSQLVRLTVGHAHVPVIVMIFLCVVATVALGFTGYESGLNGRANRVPNFLTAILIIAIFWLIIDLDTPGRGFVNVSQQPMIDTLVGIDTLKYGP